MASMESSSPAVAYPKCKYIKQNIIAGMKCPTCGDGDIAERKARRGNLFYGCTNYPKCDFTSNAKPVPEKCPECGSTYLLEKTRTTGVYLVCPNNRKSAAEEEAPKKRAKKGAAVEEPAEQITCSYSKKIAEPLPAESVEDLQYQTKAESLPVA